MGALSLQEYARHLRWDHAGDHPRPGDHLLHLLAYQGYRAGFLRQLKREMEYNALLLKYFADVFYPEPAVMSPKWSEHDGLIVRRQSNPRRLALRHGDLVDGQPVSRHFVFLFMMMWL